MAKLSVLDLAPVPAGSTIADALHNSRDLARHCEALGYQRYWVAEHHNMPGIASAATSLLISHIAAGTERILVGAGGIMLPNHAPLVIAEQFGTLAALYPDRIELGLGRAPGTDQATAYALRRNLHSNVDQFPRDVVELMHYFEPVSPGQKVRAVPGNNSNIPIWILGSSLFGAQLAAQLGLPYAFASHFAPGQLRDAVRVYRQQFKPSPQLASPYVMAGFNVFAADTQEQAHFLASSMQQAFINLRRGTPDQLSPPRENYLNSLSPGERALLADIMRCSAIGDPEMVAREVKNFINDYQVDELIVATQMYDHQARCRSYEILARCMG
ncbi:LLM class flavin-dependent oxidoreductase [Spongiibacter sp. KMU-166]|uniref:LLM class flavin-dependent oxidoreductase n=1 Tax=Spongiibacter thalassae TaxID=2721624 RepID=A0ABX1GCP6_9GAMM|nr:LLM class flavin-dependent oxidoreductase [Spongiibacter thalassae]NKI16282.1 LLM class flavin-dependent oxidoreductase [Spongiibacter thalassae]